MLTNDIVQQLWPVFLLLFIGLIFGLLLVTGVTIWTVLKYHKYKRQKRLILKFADYTAVLSFFMEKAYDIIHKDRILIYSLEATKLPDKEFGVYSKEFVRVVIKLAGPRLTSEFVYLFGDEDAFTFYLIEYFNSKYEGDEIRKASIENLMQSDIEVPEELKGAPITTKLPGQP